MVLPLIGLLALGAGAGLRGQIGGMFDRQDARNFEKSGVDFRGRGLGQAGDLAQDIFSSGMGRRAGMQEMIGQTFGQQQADASNATRLQAASISAGPAYMNARLNQEKWNVAQAEREAETQALISSGANPELLNSPGYRQAYTNALGANSDEIRHAGMTPGQIAELEARRAVLQQAETARARSDIRADQIGEENRDLQTEAQASEYQTIIDEFQNPAWVPEIELPGGEQAQLLSDIADADTSDEILTEAITFAQETNRAGRAMSVSERRALNANLQGPVLDTVRRLEQRGVLQGDEAKMLIEKLSVDGSESQILANLNSVQGQVQRARDRWFRQSELSVSPKAREAMGIAAVERQAQQEEPGSKDF